MARKEPLEPMGQASLRGKLHASRYGDEIRLAFKQGKRGVWRMYLVNFTMRPNFIHEMRATKSEQDARKWASEWSHAGSHFFDFMDKSN